MATLYPTHVRVCACMRTKHTLRPTTQAEGELGVGVGGLPVPALATYDTVFDTLGVEDSVLRVQGRERRVRVGVCEHV